MANQDDNVKKPKIPMLTQANYHVWYAAVCDELYAVDAELLFAKAALTAQNAEQNGNVNEDDVDLATRKKAYIMIQRSLSEEIKAKLHDVGRGEVETLLRRVRLTFYRPSPHMVELLHDKISTMVVDTFLNLDAYTLEFRQNVKQMISCGGTVDDSLVRMWFLKGLPSDYTMVKFNITANNTPLADAYNAVAAYAASDPKLTGSTHPAARKQGRRDRASATNEQPPKTGECHEYAKTGECRFGDACKYKHAVKQENKTPKNEDKHKAANNDTTNMQIAGGCAHCKKNNATWKNHTTADCGIKDATCGNCNAKGLHSTRTCPKAQTKAADQAAATIELDGKYNAVNVADFDVALTSRECQPKLTTTHITQAQATTNNTTSNDYDSALSVESVHITTKVHNTGDTYSTTLAQATQAQANYDWADVLAQCDFTLLDAERTLATAVSQPDVKLNTTTLKTVTLKIEKTSTTPTGHLQAPSAAATDATALAAAPAIPMLLDGGANCTVLTSLVGVTNVRPTNIFIEVGGGLHHCALVGDFSGRVATGATSASDDPILTVADARICPDFGHSIIAESYFINNNFIITKATDACTIARSGTQLKAKRDANGLYYLKITPTHIVPTIYQKQRQKNNTSKT
jgi:hypothetical protein